MLANVALVRAIMAFLDVRTLAIALGCSKLMRTAAEWPRLWARLHLLYYKALSPSDVARLMARAGDCLESLSVKARDLQAASDVWAAVCPTGLHFLELAVHQVTDCVADVPGFWVLLDAKRRVAPLLPLRLEVPDLWYFVAGSTEAWLARLRQAIGAMPVVVNGLVPGLCSNPKCHHEDRHLPTLVQTCQVPMCGQVQCASSMMRCHNCHRTECFLHTFWPALCCNRARACPACSSTCARWPCPRRGCKRCTELELMGTVDSQGRPVCSEPRPCGKCGRLLCDNTGCVCTTVLSAAEFSSLPWQI